MVTKRHMVGSTRAPRRGFCARSGLQCAGVLSSVLSRQDTSSCGRMDNHTTSRVRLGDPWVRSPACGLGCHPGMFPGGAGTELGPE